MWAQYERVIKDNGAIVLTASQPFTSALIMSNPKMFKYCWYWDKVRGVGHLNAKKQPLKSVEEICVFYKKQCTYNPQMRDREKPRKSKNRSTQQVYGKSQDVFEGDILEKRYPVTLLTYSKSKQEDFTLHPTQKPVALFEYLIRTYTNEGEIVLDNCIGSGTTAVAAINTNRQFIGIEREPEYVEIANKRIAEALEARQSGAS
ncbi:site-specific DNA-methyltransferase [Aeribacillus sp. FSL K6-1121]|uniref:DNA-methyltransferase n=1 Tax=Aeribacillus sp. FSL K6-1121 TaxID=2954745 RepID=UPI0030FAA153